MIFASSSDSVYVFPLLLILCLSLSLFHALLVPHFSPSSPASHSVRRFVRDARLCQESGKKGSVVSLILDPGTHTQRKRAYIPPAASFSLSCCSCVSVPLFLLFPSSDSSYSYSHPFSCHLHELVVPIISRRSISPPPPSSITALFISSDIYFL